MIAARWILTGLLGLSALGCQHPSYERHSVVDVQTKGGRINNDTLRVQVPVGGIISAKLTPLDNDGEIMLGANVESADPSVLEVIRVSGSSFEENHYAFVGRVVGSTELIFYADHEEVHRAVATVTAQ